MADENLEICPLSLLPEACLANIISLTSPRDACTAAAVSSRFKSAAESDTVWERFLPPDFVEIFSGSDSPAAFSTKKELYFMLCDPGLLIDGGKMSFRLNKSTGKKCYTLCARGLEIAWKDSPAHWLWTSLPESRFAEVAELLSANWLEILGIIPAQILSRNTNYAAYIVFKLSENYYGLQCSSKALVKFVKESATEFEGETRTVYIVRPTFTRVMGRRRWVRLPAVNIDGRVPCSRPDGWMEIELGDFFISEGDIFDVQIQFFETQNLNWKKGLIVEGMELRPKI